MDVDNNYGRQRKGQCRKMGRRKNAACLLVTITRFDSDSDSERSKWRGIEVAALSITDIVVIIIDPVTTLMLRRLESDRLKVSILHCN